MWRKPHVGATLSQRSFLACGVEVVEHNVDCGIRIGGDDVVHEVKEFDAPAAFLVGGNEGGKQGRGAVALIVLGYLEVFNIQIALQ